MPTFLQGIAKKAQEQPKHRFGNLYELLNETFLKECWRDIRKDAAYGADWVSAQDYEQHLDENIHDLVERLKRKQYRAKLVRRQYIPKGDGKLRPLGIPAVEDKLLQLAVTRILQAIYEQDFLRCSYGYRPNVGALAVTPDWRQPVTCPGCEPCGHRRLSSRIKARRTGLDRVHARILREC
jgi:RNA-directed DNA polymerase